MSDVHATRRAPSLGFLLVLSTRRLRQRFLAYLLLVACVQLPVSGVTALFGLPDSAAEPVSGPIVTRSLVIGLAVLVPQLFAGGFMTGALAAAMRAESSGRARAAVLLRDGYASAWRCVTPLASALSIQVAAIAVLTVGSALVALATALAAMWVSAQLQLGTIGVGLAGFAPVPLGLIAGGAAVVYLTVHWCFLSQAIVLDDCNARGALALSSRLCHPRWLFVLVATALLALLQLAVPDLAGGLAGRALSPGLGQRLAVYVVTLAIGVVSTAYQITGNVVLYELLRAEHAQSVAGDAGADA